MSIVTLHLFFWPQNLGHNEVLKEFLIEATWAFPVSFSQDKSKNFLAYEVPPNSNPSFTATSAKTSKTHPFKFFSKTSKVLFVANRPMSKPLSLIQRAWTIRLPMLMFSNPTYGHAFGLLCLCSCHSPTMNVSSSSLPCSTVQVLCSLWPHYITYWKGALRFLKPNDILA